MCFYQLHNQASFILDCLLFELDEYYIIIISTFSS